MVEKEQHALHITRRRRPQERVDQAQHKVHVSSELSGSDCMTPDLPRGMRALRQQSANKSRKASKEYSGPRTEAGVRVGRRATEANDVGERLYGSYANNALRSSDQ